MSDAARIVQDWERAGARLDTEWGRVWVLDTPAESPLDGADAAPPLFVVHGFPTNSFDFRAVLPALSRHRRVVLFDQLGFGLSDKPDRRYGIHLHADTAEAVALALGLEEVDLLTHDMGDSVGGELLARDLEGRSPLRFRRRVLTNGSIYLDLAQLTVGQQLLSALPDETMDHITSDGYRAGIAATFADGHPASEEELDAQWLLQSRQDGHRLLARTIRYLEDRRAEEARYTGAIERHAAPLTVVWGDKDPIAVFPMTDRLLEARPDAVRVVLDGVGHYPMVEDPDRLAAAVLTALD
ncbi:MAG: alpha/beta fold hydrolase [Microthrixaceae bacterium]